MKRLPIAIIAVVALTALPALAAGSVVSKTRQRWATPATRVCCPTTNQARIGQVLKSQAAQFARQAVAFAITITDIDLAGTLRTVRGEGREMRIVSSRVDAPRIALRYVLRAGNGCCARPTRR